MAKYGDFTKVRLCLQGLKNLLTFYRDSINGYIIVCQLLCEDEENLQPDGTRVSRYIPVSCAVAATSRTAAMDNSHAKTKSGIYVVESEHPFVTTQEGRGTLAVVTYYSDAHACDQKLCTDAAVESYKSEDINKSN
jgi:hypothetical protein